MSSVQLDDTAFTTGLTVFMLVKTTSEWLDLPADRRFQLMRDQAEPVLRKYQASIRLRTYDVAFYATRVTDVWVWEARDHAAYQRLLENLRETGFWDRYFAIIEILTGVENEFVQKVLRLD
jgi:hypothetical protein